MRSVIIAAILGAASVSAEVLNNSSNNNNNNNTSTGTISTTSKTTTSSTSSSHSSSSTPAGPTQSLGPVCPTEACYDAFPFCMNEAHPEDIDTFHLCLGQLRDCLHYDPPVVGTSLVPPPPCSSTTTTSSSSSTTPPPGPTHSLGPVCPTEACYDELNFCLHEQHPEQIDTFDYCRLQLKNCLHYDPPVDGTSFIMPPPCTATTTTTSSHNSTTIVPPPFTSHSPPANSTFTTVSTVVCHSCPGPVPSGPTTTPNPNPSPNPNPNAAPTQTGSGPPAVVTAAAGHLQPVGALFLAAFGAAALL